MSDTIIKKLYDFKEVTIPEPLLYAEVTKEEITAEILQTAARFTTIAAIDQPIQNGDVVVLELPDSKMPTGIRRIYENVGKGFSDLEGKLLGLGLGDAVQTVYAGREVVAKICSVKRLIIPTMTDDQIVQLGIEGVTKLPEFEEYVFQQQAEKQRKRKFKGIMGLVSKAVMEHTKFETIEENHPWYQTLYGLTMQQVEGLAKQEGKTAEEVLPMALRMPDKTVEECRMALYDMCCEHIRQGALGQAYAKEKEIVFTMEESMGRLQGYMPQPDEMAATNDLIQRYVDYFSQVVYEHFAPMIQITLR